MKKMRSNFLLLAFMAVPLVFTTSCSEDDGDEDPFIITQSELDGVTTPILEFTGGAMDHAGGAFSTGDSTVRKVYANRTDFSSVPKGTIITKHTFEKFDDESLLVTFAMVKREEGYYADGGDFEYYMMPFDASVNYTANPNGMLDKAAASGKLSNCAGCHSGASGGDWLFIND